MRGIVPDYELVSPPSLFEALQALKREPGVWRPFAGGTDLMVLFEAGLLQHKKFLNLWNLKELKKIEIQPDAVEIGALASYSDIRNHPTLRAEFPMMTEAAAVTGAIAIQNRGTIGGNIANGSPAADTPPVLLAYDAEIELASTAGIRVVKYSEFHTGYKKSLLKPEELISKIRLPRKDPPSLHFYRKVGTRKAQAISKICFAGALSLSPGGAVAWTRIGLGSVAATPIRAGNAERFLAGRKPEASLFPQARAAILKDIAPIDDIRSNAEYRREVTANLFEEFLELACGTGSAKSKT